MLSPLEEIRHEDYSLVSRIHKSNSWGVFYIDNTMYVQLPTLL